MTTRKRMCAIKGLSENKVEKIKEVANKLLGVSIDFIWTLINKLGSLII